MEFLNDKVVAYLRANNISYAIGDYQTGQPEGQPDQILHWGAKLGPVPTQAQLDSAWQAKLAADAAVAYQSQRAAKYPSIADQMDMQYWDKINGTTTWQDAIAAVKAQYPKP